MNPLCQFYLAYLSECTVCLEKVAAARKSILIVLVCFSDGSLVTTLEAIDEVELDGRKQKVADHYSLVESIGRLTPCHFLAFATGADTVPGCGWPSKPQIVFDHTRRSSLFSVSTCALKITIPVNDCTTALQPFMLAFSMSLVHGATFSDI